MHTVCASDLLVCMMYGQLRSAAVSAGFTILCYPAHHAFCRLWFFEQIKRL